MTIYSPFYRVEEEPFFEVSINGKPLPPSVQKYVEYLKVEEEENKKTTMELTLRDPYASIDMVYFEFQQEITLLCGYRLHHEERGPFEIVDIEEQYLDGMIRYIIKGEGGGRLSSMALHRSFSSGTVGGAIGTIANEANMELVVENVDGFDEALSLEKAVVQAGEAAGEFLRRIAREYGWQVTQLDNKVHITSLKERDTLAPILLRYNQADAEIVSVKVKRKKPRVSHVPLVDVEGKPTPIEEQMSSPLSRRRYGLELIRIAEEEHREEKRIDDLRLATISKVKTGAYDSLGEVVLQLEVAESNAKQAREDLKKRTKAKEREAFAREQALGRSKVKHRVQLAAIEKEGGTSAYARAGGGHLLFDQRAQPVGKDDYEFYLEGRELDGNYKIRTEKYNVTIGDDTIPILTPRFDEKVVQDIVKSHDVVEEPPPQDTVEKIARRKVIREGKLESVEVKLKFGAMLFRPQGAVYLENVSQKIDKKYRVAKVTHTFSGEFATELVLKPPKPPKKDPKPPADGVEEDGVWNPERPAYYVDTAVGQPVEEEDYVVILNNGVAMVKKGPGPYVIGED